MSIQKAKENFANEIKDRFPNITILGEYESVRKKIKFRCNIHDYVFEATPLNIKRTICGCPICKKENIKSKFSNEDFILKLNEISPNIIVISEYTGMKENILVRCADCGHEWNASPERLIYKHTGCQKCVMRERNSRNTFTTSEFILEVKRRNNCSNTFDVIGKYTGTRNKVLCKCKICGFEWNTHANSLLTDNVSCPSCKLSKGEMEIKSFLDINGIDYIMQKEFDNLLGIKNGKLKFDFYLPTYNLLIEYQGEFHDGSITNGYQTKYGLKYQQEHDKRKKVFARNNNIELLEIWYWEYDNICKILKNKLKI